MAILDTLDWSAVRGQYDLRLKASNDLARLYASKAANKFAELALGISDPDGNYSAAEHGLGPRILDANWNSEQRVFDLAGSFASLTDARIVPELIRRAHLKYLQIGVGSEISAMINPKMCWVANTRTIFTHLLIKHGDNVGKANEELRLYRDSDASSEMTYELWSYIHAELDVALTRIAKLGNEQSRKAKIEPGGSTYLWADAIASYLYDEYHT